MQTFKMASEPTAIPNTYQAGPVPHRYPLRNRSIFSAMAVQRLVDNTVYATAQDVFAGAVIDPTTGKSLTYDQLVRDDATKQIWEKAMTKELARLGQGLEGLTVGTDTIHYMNHAEINNIPKDRTITYARIVVDIRPHKEDPNRVRITVGGNLIDYPGEVTTRTADMVTSKLLWNSVISTDNARYICADVKNFYLETPMARKEYMRLPVQKIPDDFMEAYNLHDKILNGYLYMEIRKGMYGLPQSGILANTLLRKRLAPEGYIECKHTPGLWRHQSRPITFTLVVDDFGIKTEGLEHAEHLFACLRKHYTIEVD
jgi:hypothetical protein